MATLFGVKSRNYRMAMKPLFDANVEALTDEEVGLKGHCHESEGDCVYFCPQCGAGYYANGHKGGAYNVTGSCVKCETAKNNNDSE